MVRTTNYFKKWTPIGLVRLVAVLACLLLFNPAGAKDYRALIIKSKPTGIYTTIESGIIEHIRALKTDGITFTRSTVESSQRISQEAGADSYDIIVPIGLSAARKALSLSRKTPILITLVPRETFEQLLKTANRTNEDKSLIGAIYLDSHPERDLLLAQTIFGEQKKIALLTSKPKSASINRIASLARKHKLDLHINTIKREGNLIKALSAILPSSDVLLASPDPVIFNRRTVKNILLTAYRYRVPILGYSESYVKAGALASIYTTPKQIAQHAAEIITNSTKSTPPGRYYPKYFSVSVNKNVAYSLSIHLPDEDVIKEKIMRNTGPLQ
jgi:ABC-type uncharacterized transport system substrate-binding protein